MKRRWIKRMCPLLLATGCFIMLACDKPEEMDVGISHIASTKCLPQSDAAAKGITTPDTVSVRCSDGVIYVEHRHLMVNCGFETVNVTVTVDGNTIKVAEYGTPDDANCVCEINNSFQIDNVPQGTYTIVVENCHPAPFQQTINF